MKYIVTDGDEEHVVELKEHEGGRFDVTLDGEPLAADFRRTGNGHLVTLLLDGRSYELLLLRDGRQVSVIHHGLGARFQVETERERNARLIAADAGHDESASIHAVMPGIVVSIAVAEGDTVERGQPVLVLEAMKMENEIRASAAGTVARIAVRPGQTVNSGDLLVEIG